ncbi:MAG TPA: hypothetical protein VHZ74_09745 [Bryobacteraceae bacterium]|jgi:hypothetical protein|nr:hypothetical protein [Bryobacteraceae bacterium]
MPLVFASALFLICFGAIGLDFFLKLRALQSREMSTVSLLTADRYRPMLRLLSDDDLAIVAADNKLKKSMRAKRRTLFRGYLRCLTRDYASLLAGVRDAMVRSGVDRPDLARALARNRVLFALAICKVEFRLLLHATGAGTVDISGLVDALETLRSQVSVMAASPLPA